MQRQFEQAVGAKGLEFVLGQIAVVEDLCSGLARV
jgi:hypothetical protein